MRAFDKAIWLRTYSLGEADMKAGIEDALMFAQTDAYAQLVEEKLPFAAKELTWKNQFRKLASLLGDLQGGGV